MYVITDSGTGGTERVLQQALSRLDRSQAQPVGVAVLKKKREMAAAWEKSGVPVEALGMHYMPWPWHVSKLKKLVDQWRPDVVHALLFHSVQASRLALSSRSDVRLVSSPRVNYRFAPMAALQIDRWMRTERESVLCESNSSKLFMVDRLGYRKEQMRVVNNGVDAKTFHRDDAARRAIRREWGIPEGTMVIGAVGRLHEQKGFDLLLDALADMKSLQVPHHLIIVGEGPQQAELKATAQRLHLPVSFVGRRQDMSAVFSAFDIFVQSSRYEGMSNALLEAMACGCACVATAVDGTLDIARDGENMLLVKPESSSSLAVGLGMVLEKPELRQKLSRHAVETAARCSVDAMVKGFESVYSWAMSRKI